MGHRKKSIKRSRTKTILRRPDLEQSKNAVLNSLAAASSQESYGHAIDEFMGWYCSKPRLAFNRSVVLRYRIFLEQKNPSTINVRLAAVRRPAQEPCSRNSKETACEESVIEPLALHIGCGLRHAELVGLGLEDFQVREEHWVIADLIGKGKHIRSAPVPAWAKRVVDDWTDSAGIRTGTLLRRVGRLGKIWGSSLTPKAIWHIARRLQNVSTSRISLRMTYDAPAHDSVTWPGRA
jgi:integrase